MDPANKRKIGSMMCHFLLDKIKYDLVASSHVAGASRCLPMSYS